MTAREALPNRRPHETLDFEHAGFHYTAGIGRFPDGRLAEVFLDAAKQGTAIGSAARDLAVVASIAMQYGADADTIRHALTRDENDKAAGPLGALLDLLNGGAP